MDEAPPIMVVVADDHPTTRAGLRTSLQEPSDIEVIGEAADGWAAQDVVARLRPDVLLLDLQMPGPGGAELAAWVREHCPETVTLVLTAHDRDAYLAEMLDEGAQGFLTKIEAPRRLIDAIRRAARGEVLFSEAQRRRVQEYRGTRREQERAEATWAHLTSRERDVLSLLAQGQSNPEIAETLCIAESTVETHVSNMLQKLGVDNRTRAAAWAWKHGFVREDEGAT